ncbi:MAG: DNA mismatch repair protein MutS, partial [Chlamydiia bacterium]|nr:DNA mismatch repair protein MutS [Chlamydiia bacterium]
YHTAYPALTQHFKVHSLDGFGLKSMTAGVHAAGALINYIQDTLHLPANHIRSLSTYCTDDFMSLDRITQRNLELTESLNDGSRRNTLLDVLDSTCTPMGGRLLRQWVKQPLLNVDAIRARQEGIRQLLDHTQLANELKTELNAVRDLERLMMKVSAGYASPRDLLSLAQSLQPLPRIKTLLYPLASALLNTAEEKLGDFTDLASHVSQALCDEPPARVSDGKIFREGYNRELDELRAIGTDAKAWLSRYQAK